MVQIMASSPSHIRVTMAALSWIALVTAAIGGCSPRTPTAPGDVQIPTRQFVLEGLRIEERREGQLLWTGTAVRADGDLSNTDVEDFTLVRPSTGAKGGVLTVTAPKGTLHMDAGTATFVDVRVVDDNGSTLTATSAAYDGKAERLDVAGPLDFRAAGLVATAKSAVVQLDVGSMQIAGPVSGRYVKPPRRQP